MIIGEDHEYEGNSRDVLSILSQRYKCPIHVLVEKSFDTYWRFQPDETYKSNSVVFYFPPLERCTRKGHIPKTFTPHIKHSDYFLNCLEPYKGRIKIWAIDIRRTSIFHLISTPLIDIYYEMGHSKMMKYIKFNNIWIEWYRTTKDLLIRLFDVELASQNIKEYDRKVIEGVYLFYEKIPKDAPYSYFSPNEFKKQLTDVLATRDKSHIDLMKSLLHLPKDVIKGWHSVLMQGINKFPIHVLFMIGLHDLYMMIRLYRLLQHHKEGLILFFGGFLHTHQINQMIQKLNDIDHLTTMKESGKDHLVSIPLPKIQCQETLPSMELFIKN